MVKRRSHIIMFPRTISIYDFYDIRFRQPNSIIKSVTEVAEGSKVALKLYWIRSVHNFAFEIGCYDFFIYCSWLHKLNYHGSCLAVPGNYFKTLSWREQQTLHSPHASAQLYCFAIAIKLFSYLFIVHLYGFFLIPCSSCKHRRCEKCASRISTFCFARVISWCSKMKNKLHMFMETPSE